MDKETLSNYGWIVICVLVLAVMIALAGPFGNFVADAVKSTTQGLFDTNKNALDAAGIVIDDNGFADADGGLGDIGYDHNVPVLHPSRTIPDGATYTIADGTTLHAGDEFPNVLTNKDIYEYGDYKYTYYTARGGWSVALNTNVTDKNQTSYGAILESINGEPVNRMYTTFLNCDSLTAAPVIPVGVTDMSMTFKGCENLTTAPEIPIGATDISNAFNGCNSLTTAPVIPVGVTDMSMTFHGCTSLTTAPEIPNSVTTMQNTFYNCTSLVAAPEIPSSVTNMSRTFSGCTSLTGTVTINANPTEWTSCLYNTKITSVKGDTTMAASILKTKTTTTANPTA